MKIVSQLRPFQNFAAFLVLVVLGSSLLLTLAYSLPSNFKVAVGEFGDGPWIEGFNSDEPGAPRYRWTGNSSLQDGQAEAVVHFPVALPENSSGSIKLELGSVTLKDSGLEKPPVVMVLSGGVKIGEAQTVAGVVKSFEFALPPEVIKQSNTGNFQLELRSSVFRASGRTLGVKVQAVSLHTTSALRFPPFEVWFWGLVYTFFAGLVVARALVFVRQKKPSKEPAKDDSAAMQGSPLSFTGFLLAGVGGFVLMLPVLAIPYLAPANVNFWYGPSDSTPYLLQLASWVMAGLGLLAWQAVIGKWLLEFPAKLENGKFARNILIIASILYFVYAFAVIAQMDYIGHADYADNGVVARNLVRGNGFAVDYAAQFYTFYDKLPHPADTWPLLQPLMIAPFFAVLGATAFAAKLPNLLLMLALVWAIFRWGSRYFNRKTGLAAALLALFAPALYETVVFPINDLAFTFFSFLALLGVYRAANYRPVSTLPDAHGGSLPESAGQSPPTGKIGLKISSIYAGITEKIPWVKNGRIDEYKPWLWAALWGGLLLWSKPSGAVILVAAWLWLLWQKFFNKGLKINWRALILWGGLVVLILSPYLARGIALEGTPLYSTERYDAWLLGYAGPWERIYDLYYPTNKALPEPRMLLNYGFDTVLKVKYNQFKAGAQDFLEGNFVAPLLWLLALVGLAGLPRRRYGLAGLVAFAFIVYLLFIDVYWHYEIRYFLNWLPWMFLFGAYGLSWIYDRIRQESPDKPHQKAGRLGGWLIAAALAVLLLPNLPHILDSNYTAKTGIVTVSDWFKANTNPDTVIMSRNVWELSFHADRKSVMFPNNVSNLSQLKSLYNDYKVKYLQFDHIELTGGSNPRPENPIWQERPAVWPLIVREQVPGYKLVYDKGGFLVYEITGED